MSVTYSAIIPSKFVESTDSVQYQCPTGSKCVIDKITLSNPTNQIRKVSFWIVKNMSSASNENIIAKDIYIYPSSSVSVVEISGHVLESLDSIMAVCDSASSVSIRGSGRIIV